MSKRPFANIDDLMEIDATIYSVVVFLEGGRQVALHDKYAQGFLEYIARGEADPAPFYGPFVLNEKTQLYMVEAFPRRSILCWHEHRGSKDA